MYQFIQSNKRYPSSIFGEFQHVFNFANEDYYTRLTVKESDSEYTGTLNVPGFGRDELSVEIQDGILYITGHRKGEKNPEEAFERSITLWDGIQVDKTTAKVENGVLTLTFPKEEEKKPMVVKVL